MAIQKKIVVIFFGNKAHLKKLDNKTVRYFDTPLKRKDKVKYLGVLFDAMEFLRFLDTCLKTDKNTDSCCCCFLVKPSKFFFTK